jgi:hypothetical protein
MLTSNLNEPYIYLGVVLHNSISVITKLTDFITKYYYNHERHTFVWVTQFIYSRAT